MAYFFFGVAIGLLIFYVFFQPKKVRVYEKKDKNNINDRRQQAKIARLEKVLKLFEKNDQLTNNDVERALKISDRTASRYLDELEEEGFVKKHGKTRGSYYTKI